MDVFLTNITGNRVDNLKNGWKCQEFSLCSCFRTKPVLFGTPAINASGQLFVS